MSVSVHVGQLYVWRLMQSADTVPNQLKLPVSDAQRSMLAAKTLKITQLKYSSGL